MRKTILLLLIAAFCASSCKDTFMFDKMYEDEGVFDLKVRIDNPTNITSSGAKISVPRPGLRFPLRFLLTSH